MAGVLKQGKLTEVAALYEQALTIKKASRGTDRTKVVATLNNMAIVLQKQGN